MGGPTRRLRGAADVWPIVYVAPFASGENWDRGAAVAEAAAAGVFFAEGRGRSEHNDGLEGA
ncbi:hypothetical protein RCR19_34780 [Streptomyces sp. WAC07094]|uniref:hypothetical protein n=1 Tax=Streptomyces sp. WAC07094 TaxID=3072183 RepID=UPI002EAA6EBE|nr:hypothetical protein [Streptomyces sp. WAC07094]